MWPFASKKVGLLYDSRMEAHCNPSDPEHPECPQRTSSIFHALQTNGLVQRYTLDRTPTTCCAAPHSAASARPSRCERIDVRPATDAELVRGSTHSHKHCQRIQSLDKLNTDKERMKFAKQVRVGFELLYNIVTFNAERTYAFARLPMCLASAV